MSPPEQPPRRTGLSRTEDRPPLERLPGRTSPPTSMLGEEREYFLQKLRDQTDEITGKVESKIDELKRGQEARDREVDKRLTELERSRLEDKATRLAVQDLSVNVRTLIDSNRAQDIDIGSIRAKVEAAIKPTVVAEANTEGQIAGHAAGSRIGRFWAILGVVLAAIATSAMQYCEHQIAEGAFSQPLNK